jgi:16S rRNA (cytosine967-C5)-methyltransferase
MPKDIIHPHLIEGICLALFEIFHDGFQSDRVINKTLKERKKWGSRDRRIFAESVYECSRWWRRLWFAAGFIEDCFIPENISLKKTETLWRLWVELHAPSFVNNPGKPASSAIDKWNNPPDRATRESVSDWLDQEGSRELGENWDTLLTSLNKPAKVYLRTNLLKITRDILQKKLTEISIFSKTTENDNTALKLVERKNVFITDPFKNGFFEVQDIGSQQIALFLEPQPGMRVIDACAGGGGKSLHIASIMQNKGRIIALDKNDWRLAPLRERASRAGADIIEARVIHSMKVVKRLYDSADRLLLDVPCSGTGVLRRNPDAKWRLEQSQKDTLLEVQQEILQKYSPMVKENGIMVYSTCSIFPSENQNQILKFLNSKAGENWTLIDHVVILPAETVSSGADSSVARVKSSSETINPETDSYVARVSAPRTIYLDSDSFYMAKLQRKP